MRESVGFQKLTIIQAEMRFVRHWRASNLDAPAEQRFTSSLFCAMPADNIDLIHSLTYNVTVKMRRIKKIRGEMVHV